MEVTELMDFFLYAHMDLGDQFPLLGSAWPYRVLLASGLHLAHVVASHLFTLLPLSCIGSSKSAVCISWSCSSLRAVPVRARLAMPWGRC